MRESGQCLGRVGARRHHQYVASVAAQGGDHARTDHRGLPGPGRSHHRENPAGAETAVAARTLYQGGHAGGDYVLTGSESLSQAEQVSIIGDVLGRRITCEELSPDEFRSETEGSWPRPVVDMLLAAWGATMGRPAFITSTVFDILGSAPRSFRQSVADHATAFIEGPTPSS